MLAVSISRICVIVGFRLACSLAGAILTLALMLMRCMSRDAFGT